MKIKYIHTEDPRCESFNKLISENFPEMLSEENPDLILVCGGDGAMLHAIQDYREFNVPFLGKAAGTLNFLMNNFDDDIDVLRKIMSKKYKLDIEETVSISVDLKTPTGTKHVGEAINEITLGSSIMGYHEFRMDSEDEAFSNFRFKGSGLSISAPLGTTGFNFNNRGAVLPLASELWSITGIVSNTRINDILETQTLTIEILGLRNEGMKIFIDGIAQPSELQPGDIVTLKPGKAARIAFIDVKEFRKHRFYIANRHRR